jgi:SAM-dependent methyltransferase
VTSNRLDVPRRFQRSLKKDEEFAILSARLMIPELARLCGHDDLGELSVLDVGCGVKFSQVLVNDGLPIGRYVGVDVYRPMIEFLRENVTDERFEFHHVDFRNERYNPEGIAMTADSRLPVPETAFDVICLFSVFTHLDPSDYVAILKLLRRYVKPTGRAVYSIFLDRLSSTGHGLMDAWARKMGEQAVGKTETYRDFTHDDPLKQALYSEEYARELVEDTGWRVDRIIEPTEYVQHQFVVVPVPAA